MSNPIRPLQLPRRWEVLQAEAEASYVDPVSIVERVEDAEKRVDRLLRRIRDGGGGVIEVFYGLSGSGKTTFLSSLPSFFEGVRVSVFDSDQNLIDLPNFIKRDADAGLGEGRIILISRRDNPTPSDLEHVKGMLNQLLNTFREQDGAAVVLWPITDKPAAETIAKHAYDIGRDSMTDRKSNGLYHFRGVPKERYWHLADNTSRTLSGDGLEAHGITESEGLSLLSNCETISDYFAELIDLANDRRDELWSALKEKIVPHLWVALPGDDARAIRATADALTQGTQSKIDIDKVGEFIDQPDQNAIYVEKWKTKRGQLAHLLRALDVRLFAIPPNVALAAVRALGSQNLKGLLKQPNTNLTLAKDAMRSSQLYKAILAELGLETVPFRGARRIAPETQNEYLRVQAVAAKSDKELNHALGKLIAACLEEDAPSVEVSTEKKSIPNSSLRPDINIKINDGEFICIEPTWRNSGQNHPDTQKTAQNTLSEAHIKKYVLDKTTDYIDAVGI
jgi:hypothetical protein